MKRHVHLFLIFCLFTCGQGWSQSGGQAEGSEQPASAAVFEERHREYVQLWTGLVAELERWTPRINHQRTKETIERSLSALRAGKIEVRLYPAPDIQWIDSITHSFEEEGEKIILSVSHQFLDGLELNDYFGLSRLVHELKHVSDYIGNFQEMVRFKDNVTEQFLYEMDALFIEAVFNRELANFRSGPAGTYIDYLVSNLDTDNLAGAAILFSVTNMNLVYDFYGRRLRAEASEDAVAAIAAYLEVGEDWLAKEEGEDNWQNLLRVATLRTWTLHAQNLMGPLFSHMTQEEIDAALADLNALRERIVAEIDRLWDVLIPYRNQLFISIFTRE